MGQPPVFDFFQQHGEKLDEKDTSSVRARAADADKPEFEPTRDGWRAYEAWCKQIRDEWDSDS